MLNTTQNMHINIIIIIIYKRKTYKHNPKVSPFCRPYIALVKKKKLGDTGTIDRFGLAFQIQIFLKYQNRLYNNNRKVKVLYKFLKANTSAICLHVMHIPATAILIS